MSIYLINVWGVCHNSITTKKGQTMDNDIKKFLYIYAIPIAVISLVMVFIAPAVFSQAILAMIASASLICIGMVLLMDYLDN